MKIILSVLIVVVTTISPVSATQSCLSDTGVANRYQLLGEDLALGDELTLTIGGYTVNYLVNDFSKAAGQWPRYLATEINAVVPASLAKAGDASNNYLPVASSTDNRLDLLQPDIPVTFLKNGVNYSFHLVAENIITSEGLNPIFCNVGKRSAVVNHFSTYTFNSSTANQYDTFIYMTNITVHPVIVTVSFFDQHGVLISDTDNNPSTGLLRSASNTDYVDVSSSFSSRFILNGNHTTLVVIDNLTANQMYGYAYIEWSAVDINENTDIALMAHAQVYRTYNGNLGYYDIEINEGKPF